MDTLQLLLHYLLHIDTFLMTFVSNYGYWTYFLLFLIIFCETGLVIAPFLPGDSLLFTAGSLAAHHTHPLSVEILLILLMIASILGNKTNYLIGKWAGPHLFKNSSNTPRWQNRLLNRKYLEETHQFYERYGAITIILARYLPIIRTFAPFVAGMANMSLKRFTFYNIISAVLWIGSLVGAGYFFGSLPIIRDNFSIVVYGIILLSVLPAIFAVCYRKFLHSKML